MRKEPSEKKITVALVGQPNVGKSSLFNALAGGKAEVANWPGVTVEKLVAKVKYGDYTIELVDLPGAYSLTPLTIEEKVTRDFVVKTGADVYVALVDATMLERTLPLPLELLEATDRVVIALTKSDEAHKKGIHINVEKLSKLLGVPVVSVSATKKLGINELLRSVIEVYSKNTSGHRLVVDYGVLQPYIKAVEEILESQHIDLRVSKRWLALKLLEGDAELYGMLDENTRAKIAQLRDEASKTLGLDIGQYVTVKRFEHSVNIGSSTVVKHDISKNKGGIALFYNPYAGALLSIATMLLIVSVAFIVNTGYPLTDLLRLLGREDLATWLEEHSVSTLLENLFSRAAEIIHGALGDSPAASLLADGVLGGVGTILSFLPLIAIVLFFYALLEDSGVLPRMAVGTHPLFSKIGLSGHALFPFFISFGCNVPGIVASRSSPSATERLKLVLSLPLVPCQARLVVLLALSSLVGPRGGYLIILSYLSSILAFILLNVVVDVFTRKKKTPELLIELPNLHSPIPRVIWWIMWKHLKNFLVKAGSILLLASLAVWATTHITPSLQYTDSVEESVLGGFSMLLSGPVSAVFDLTAGQAIPIAIALVVGFVAKELVVSTLLVVTGASTIGEIREALNLGFVQVAALSVFVTLYVPCLATVVTIYAETRSAKWTILSVIILLAIGTIFSLITRALLAYFL